MKNSFPFRLLIPLLILVIASLLALAVHALWNNVLADVLPVKNITYWQALGILVLSRILFGGFPGRRGPFGPPGRRMMMQRWQSLSPDQREKMRQRFGNASPWWDTPAPPETSATPAPTPAPSSNNPTTA